MLLLQFIAGCTIDTETVYDSIRPLLMKLGDFRSLTLNVIQRLSSLVQLFPNTFNEKLCDQLMVGLPLGPAYDWTCGWLGVVCMCVISLW